MPQEPPTLTIRSGTIADNALITRMISEPAGLDNALRLKGKSESSFDWPCRVGISLDEVVDGDFLKQ
jgi:hypothetical protein